jgi:hypothetical protein
VIAAVLVKVLVVVEPLAAEDERAAALPVGAARYLAEAQPAGPMFNSYNWGGFLAWELYGQYPVYVDGRTDLYPNEFLLAYLDTAFTRPGWQERLDREGINLIVMEANSQMAHLLQSEPGWALAYDDELAAVFTRAGP